MRNIKLNVSISKVLQKKRPDITKIYTYIDDKWIMECGLAPEKRLSFNGKAEDLGVVQ